MSITTNDARRHILSTARIIIAGKGFSAVGLNEILQAAGVPKGSFYYYFGSKDTFGEALLEDYFADYLAALDDLLGDPDLSAAQRLIAYFEHWLETQAACDPKGKCLAVKLAAEVSDLSEVMRSVLEHGTTEVIARLASTIEDGANDGSLPAELDASATANALYHLWLGASLRAKITRDRIPMESALTTTKSLLSLSSHL
ncbi:TetR/AcrR family transcriptional regulator [Burkholderia vietnamiensis]|uniref:TetR/AcrR family transcriptional regulator n=1 Tax=Burkholderia vietnamiensis TaxID=60552 RepID=A0AAW7T0Q1_BURVI|nr:TetR/AcrR family transcriptional regulator [Burkholderia vietnamiensis]MBH9645840.1 TetR/AcrR family transcriptional regulator [Burkholderia vietnamiensis]MBR8008851.1 TetR/AcrR family transcriptional regulator [Burkholderia vietnamiensis]MDN7551291.1 TetR/AcrR family transcriptional regulator [Burkholderia vietnamiensis]MDN7795105.1 TetR/AcrR family transcriptional regulator [Burkholderia vietnamiensis]MDN8043617.1 TetR/AcrR family transcriptional regulator [Burkholderia vietnamiensis]